MWSPCGGHRDLLCGLKRRCPPPQGQVLPPVKWGSQGGDVAKGFLQCQCGLLSAHGSHTACVCTRTCTLVNYCHHEWP